MWRIILLFLFGASAVANEPQRPFLTLKAVTSSNTSKTVREKAVNMGWRKAGEMTSTRVSVSCSFFKAPPWPYEVQVFFVAKDESTRERYVYSVQKEGSSDMAFGKEFESPQVSGTITKTLTLQQSGTFSGTYGTPRDGGVVNGKYRGTITTTRSLKGSKTDGWIVRVIANGEVIKSAASDNPLLTLAEKNIEALHAMANE